MIKLAKLKTYEKTLRTNLRSNGKEIEALDVNGTNRVIDIAMTERGYVLKPNEVYIAEVDNPSSPSFAEENFREELLALGINCRVLDDECYITVQRPVRIYPKTGLFREGR